MSGAMTCKQCGCSEIDTDPARGDAVCTSCGYVLEESIIVSEVTFEEDGHGGASAVGQFVSTESRGGGGSGLTPGGFHNGIGKESREITLRSAKRRITDVAQQLRLNQHCIDVAFNFFKMALHKQLTKGRRHPLTIAACIYMTCRMEGTPHLLIDFSDVVQMDVYALGRAYVQISRALFINIPAVDPCLYILRFAHKFNLGSKTHEVSVTALRLVQRMKRDWIHFGRRPSGVCGAALLIAARIHGFSRSVQDVINVVKVHETTLRRRLIEFGETPSSSLTMDEFMSVDLEEEHDPPAFKAARVKDRDQLQKLLDDGEMAEEFNDIKSRIDSELERRKEKNKRKQKSSLSTEYKSRPSIAEAEVEIEQESRAIDEATRSSINELVPEEISVGVPPIDLIPSNTPHVKIKREIKREIKTDPDRALMPPPRVEDKTFDLEISRMENREVDSADEEEEGGELDLTGIDDNEIDGYLMNEFEAERKRILWERLNSEYLQIQEAKKRQMEEDIQNGKFDKKRKIKDKSQGKQNKKFQAKSANDAIKIMLEKKLSNKINYEVLKTLTPIAAEHPSSSDQLCLTEGGDADDDLMTVIESGPVIPKGRGRQNQEHLNSTERVPRKRYRSESENMENLRSSSSVSFLIDPDTKTIVLKPIKGEPYATSSKPHLVSSSVTPNPPRHPERELVVESGPVQYASELESNPTAEDMDNYDEDGYDEDEEEEDEGDDEMSVNQLLTKFRGQSGQEENNYSDYY